METKTTSGRNSYQNIDPYDVSKKLQAKCNDFPQESPNS